MAGWRPESHSVPVRERILQCYDHGDSTAGIAEFFGCCVAAVRRVRQQFQARGSLVPHTHWCGRKSLLTARRKARRQKRVAATPDATLAELGSRLDRPFGTSTIDLWLRRLGWSFKKTLPAAEQDRPDADAAPLFAVIGARWHRPTRTTKGAAVPFCGSGFQPDGSGGLRAARSFGGGAARRGREHGAGMPREPAGKDACPARLAPARGASSPQPRPTGLAARSQPATPGTGELPRFVSSRSTAPHHTDKSRAKVCFPL